MRTIFYIVRKEFQQIRRNRMMLPIIFIMPIMQLLILAPAVNFEMKSIKMHIVDLDRSSVSHQIINKFMGSPFYRITGTSFSDKEGQTSLMKNKADIVMQIPLHFERDLRKGNKTKIMLNINAINAATASLSYAYTISIIGDYNKTLMAQWGNSSLTTLSPGTININFSHWFNPELKYINFMVPGILSLLVTMIGLLLAALNIVGEKEKGTIEQINVSPIKKYHFIAGKLIPFWLIALFELALGLTIGKIIFAIPIQGNLLLLFSFVALYLVVVLSIGLLISTVNNTQQQALFISWFFMIVFILMSGLFTPIESMPLWAQYFNIINPVAVLVKVMRMIMLKGSGFADIKQQFIYIGSYAVMILSLAVWRYRKAA